MTRSHLLWSGWGGRSQTMLQNAFFERRLVSDHPVCGWLSVASRLFIEAAATPPQEEGNAPTPHSLVIHSPFSRLGYGLAPLLILVSSKNGILFTRSGNPKINRFL